MKKAIVILSAILVVLLVIAMFVAFGMEEEPSAPIPPSTTVAPTAATTEAPTAPPTEPPTEAPTDPPLQTASSFILNGTELSALTDGSAIYVRADEFATACGLEFDGTGTFEGTDSIVLSADSTEMTLNGQSYAAKAAPLIYEEQLYIPAQEISEALEYSFYTDSETGMLYITPAARRFEIPEGVDVPVLMYHAVSDNMWGINELFVSPSSLDEQFAYLVENGYDPIWFEDLAHLEDYDKPVILTFDDGYDDNYLEMFPIAQKYNVKVTVFVIGNAAGTSHKMTEEQIRELADSGLVSIQSHGYTHDDMDAMDEATLDYELSESKRVITRITGREPYVLCYPTGKYSDVTLEVAERYYNFGLKMVGGQYNTSDDPYLVSRYYVSRYYDIYTFASYLSTAGNHR